MGESKVRQVTGGLVWTYAERLTAQLITIVVTIVLTRIIAPDEYGIISIVSVFITIANAFVISGFGNSLIQKKDADKTDFSTVFYFSLVFSLGLYIILFISAPYIAEWYKMPLLKPVIWVMGIRLPIAAINSVQQAYISKQMQFKKFFFATLWGTIISAVVGISMAYFGFGIWALVAQYLTNVCIDTVVLWFTSGWRPQLLYSHERMKELFSYGWKIMCVGVMTTLYSNLRNLVIGKKYSSAELAFCEKGEQFPSAIAGNINSSITKVLFPVLSEMQCDTEQMKRAVRRSIKVGTYILFPIMTGFAMVSDRFVACFMTNKWLGCVPYLQIMCLTYALQPLQTSALQSIKAMGKSTLYLVIDIVKKIVGVFLLLITVFCFNSVFVIVLGALILEVFSVLILLPINRMNLKYGYIEQVLDIVPNVLISIIMCATVFVLDFVLPTSGLIYLILEVLVGGVVYYIVSLILHNENYLYIAEYGKSILKERNKA